MRAALEQVIGQYTPTGADIAGMDWEYIVCAVIFIMFLWFTLSYLRTVICGIMSRRW